jgi:DNA-binding transcriptional LysR family regulator
MDTQQLKNFLILCETLNYREASERINIVQPALSRQIQQMEEQVGALLFDRNKRNVNLTAAGEYFKVECDRIIHDFEKAISKTAQIHRGEAGTIRIGHASSAMQTILPCFLVKIKDTFPDIKTELLENANRQLVEMLLNRKIDIAFGPNISPPAEAESKIIYEENFVILLPKNHPISSENFTDLSVFANEKFILPPCSVGLGYVETIEQICYQHGFKPKVVHESAQSMSVQRLVEAGMGISIEPLSSMRGIDMEIKFIELKNIPQKAQMKMLWLKERAGELEKFLEMI